MGQPPRPVAHPAAFKGRDQNRSSRECWYLIGPYLLSTFHWTCWKFSQQYCAGILHEIEYKSFVKSTVILDVSMAAAEPEPDKRPAHSDKCQGRLWGRRARATIRSHSRPSAKLRSASRERTHRDVRGGYRQSARASYQPRQIGPTVRSRALHWSGNPYGNGYGLEMDGNGAQFVKRLWIGLDLVKAISLKRYNRYGTFINMT